ncbi:5572_t:CDS:2 [Dentiscutata erythropus]|uniref:tRNA(Ile)-lysidine synthetase n=1 Tax=Dentiscutata erythropus TaxID=1348616 RepID=A0A9N8VPC0_9GLOM|nr:5572_t:CDS:2 [Dentiscutata erythropus]
MASRNPISLKEFISLMNKFHIKKEEPLGMKCVAVSGGVDSMALCYLLNKFSKEFKHKLTAFIIDHKFRPESTEESYRVANILSKLDIDTKIMQINWEISEGNNLSDTLTFPTISQQETFARIERYKLLARGCHERKISSLFLGHHHGDQLETVIMRLARGSGINGLTSMEYISQFPIIRNVESLGINIIRPFLRLNKNRLIETCKAENIPWFEDSTNLSKDYKRNVVRLAINELNQRYLNGQSEYEPLSTEGLSRFMEHMNYHKNCVKSKVKMIVSNSIKFDSDNGICSLYLPKNLPHDHWFREKYLGTRIIALIIRWIQCSEQVPRLDSVLRCYQHIMSSYTSHNLSNITIHGVLLNPGKIIPFGNTDSQPWIFFRQPVKVSHDNVTIQQINPGDVVLWDKRFFIGLDENIPLSHESSIFKVRRFCESDIHQFFKMNSTIESQKRFRYYLSQVSPIGRYTIPVLISQDKHAVSEKLIGYPTLNIILYPEIHCWVNFDVFGGVKLFLARLGCFCAFRLLLGIGGFGLSFFVGLVWWVVVVGGFRSFMLSFLVGLVVVDGFRLFLVGY